MLEDALTIETCKSFDEKHRDLASMPEHLF